MEERIHEILSLAKQLLLTHPGYVALAGMALGAIAKRLRWRPWMLYPITRVAREGASRGSVLAQLMFSPIVAIETASLPLQFLLAVWPSFSPRKPKDSPEVKRLRGEVAQLKRANVSLCDRVNEVKREGIQEFAVRDDQIMAMSGKMEAMSEDIGHLARSSGLVHKEDLRKRILADAERRKADRRTIQEMRDVVDDPKKTAGPTYLQG